MCKLKGTCLDPRKDRCPHTPEKQERANTNRREARAKRSDVAALVGASLGAEAGAEIMQLKPSQLALATLHLERHDPELGASIRRSIGGEFPGTHNMVLQDTRSPKVSTDFTEEGVPRPAPLAVQKAHPTLVALDRALLDRADMPLAEYEDLKMSVAVREKALELGLPPGMPISSKTELNPAAAHWLGSVHPEAVPHLMDEQQGVADTMYDAAFRNASFDVSQRACTLPAADARRTFADLYAEAADADPDRDLSDPVTVDIGEGIVLTADTEGNPVIKVDDRLTLPVRPGATPDKVVPKVLRVDGIRTDPKTDAPMGQASLYERIVSEKTPQGQATRRALSDAAVEAAFFADRPVGRKEISDGLVGVRANVARPGKSPRVDAATMAGHGQTHGEITHRREEGFLLSGIHARAKTEAGNAVDAVLSRNGKPTLDKTPEGHVRPKVDRTYRGALGKEPLAQVRRSGFGPRTGKEDVAVPKVGDVPATTLSEAGGRMVALRMNKKPMSDAEVDRMVVRANRVTRRGRNPETVGNRALTDAACLDRRVLDRVAFRRMHGEPEVHTGAVVQSLPAGVSVDQVFTPGGAIDTKGAVAIGSGDLLPVEPKSKGDRQVKVVYQTGSAALVSPNRAVIGDGARFRVDRVDNSGDMPIVYMIEEDLAVDGGA